MSRCCFAPAAFQLKKNSEDAVACISKKALQLKDIGAALTALCALHGVGPATASCVLAAVRPAEAPFMADEAVEGVPGLAPVDYSKGTYLKFCAACIERAQGLDAEARRQGHAEHWTPELVGRALWTCAKASILDMDAAATSAGKVRST